MYRFNLFIKITASKHAIGNPLQGHYTSSLSANLKDCFTMHLSMNEELSLGACPRIGLSESTLPASIVFGKQR